MAESTIRAIDSTSIHRITSGQVVVDLQSAVKELVENSLDAGATSIEVRFKDYGLKSIEIIDNGHGVAPEDYDNMALKHHTSKLTSFEDLGTVLTFGFRGEALSSLCALSSSVSVATATAAQAPMGTILEFDRTGRVKNRTGRIARQRGTSVTITGLFTPLPVRRKELEKNVKREFGKALNLLQSYALVPCANENRGVRLTVSNHPTKGARSIQIRTDGTHCTRTSVSSLWGPKSLDNVHALQLDLEVEPERSSLLKKRGVVHESVTAVKVRGLISKFSPGCGRTSTDRQFFFVNGRPCNLNKIQKAFNEIYRSFNANQVPFVIADFQLPTHTCDINLSPDKRTIFIHSENNLIQALRTSLEETFSSSRSTFAVNGASSGGRKSLSRQRSGSDQGGSPVGDSEQSQVNDETGVVYSMDAQEGLTPEYLHSISKTRDNEAQDRETNGETTAVNPSMRARSSSRRPTAGDERDVMDHIVTAAIEPGRNVGIQLDEEDGLTTTVDASLLMETDEEVPSPQEHNSGEDNVLEPGVGEQPPSPASRQTIGLRSPEERPRKRRRTTSPAPAPSITAPASPPAQTTLPTADAIWNRKNQFVHEEEASAGKEKGMPVTVTSRNRFRSQLSGFSAPGSQMRPIEADEEEGDDEDADQLIDGEASEDADELIDDEVSENPIVPKPMLPGDRTVIDLTESPTDDATGASSLTPSEARYSEEYIPREEIIRTATTGVTLRFDMDHLLSTWSQIRSGDPRASLPPSTATEQSANVANADDPGAAERELARIIHKEDFSSMKILGQFNLGFIITRRISSADDRHGGDDLFIVDQHAADEKYNFETLQQTTKIESQKLFQPRPLELTAADEMIAIDNVDILRANGFEIIIDEEAHTVQRKRLKLAAQPVSKGTTFDMQDLEELLHLLRDQPNGQMVRCSKARAMFAMRACRKSVMVGKALTVGQMTSVVRHMGTMDQPWNCPHGRPTMRHLVSLDRMDVDSGHERKIEWGMFGHIMTGSQR